MECLDCLYLNILKCKEVISLARPVKCPICGEFGDREGMVFVEKSKRYYHVGSCIESHNKAQEETDRENEQWDKLYKYIANLHDLLFLPKENIFRLKSLRAGFEVKNGKRVKKYRTGPDYELMLDAYKLAEDSIRWNITNTLKGNNDIGAISYCISIMINKLNEAHVRRRKRIALQSEYEKNAVTLENKSIDKPEKPKVKKQDDMDITSFL